LQRLLARMRASGVGAAAMEVSSHGLALRRVDGTRFACAVFTNLTQDHLDFHSSMADYFVAKARLFSRELSERAAVNIDDEHGSRLAHEHAIPTVTFAIERRADVRGRDIALDRTGSRFVAEVGRKRLTVHVPIAGRFNVLNALATLAAFHALELSLDAAAEGIAKVPGVPGRFETIDAGQDFTVLVDYAHTPDSLENALRAAAELRAEGARLVCVFGCGGDRDRAKRPLMGRIAATLADHTVITSDNPRSEDPGAIIATIESGAREGGGSYIVVPDRREAIRAAAAMASAGDVVVIAGKGHESGQEFADRIVPFDDRDVARSILEELCSR
jgi:UDP-N-acetylmuramoyl-L-alanyl-D-glutamate--2,6-diaminopimelate ligase